MSLTSLPLEVLETILLHLGVKDLTTLCETVDIKVNDYFWKQVCLREGYVRPPDSDHCWETVFQLNNNWASDIYVKREYQFDYPKRNVDLTRNGNLEHFIHGHNILIQTDRFNLSVWNVEEAPNLVQTLPNLYLTSVGTKILTKDSSSMIIYSICDKIYKELVKIDIDANFVLTTDYCMTNDFFAAFDNANNSNSIKIINLSDLEIFEFIYPSKRRLKLYISNDILYVMVLKEAKYLLMRFNLVKRVELEEFTLFSGAYMINVPMIKMSSNLIVSWCRQLDTDSLTPIKVWNTDGNLLNVLPCEFTGCPHVEWMIVEGDYIICSPSLRRVVIWCSREPDDCSEIIKDHKSYNGQKTVSSSLLILSYTHCFKVVDFKKATYLYEVTFETKRTIDSLDFNFTCTHFFANHYYYVVLQSGSVEDCVSGDGSVSDASTLASPVGDTKSLMCVYDFRGKSCPI